jgi:hypothetical protein
MLKRVTRNQDRRKPNRRPRDSGAAMVEMAMVFGLLVTLLVGVVTSAIAFAQQNSVENAAREASRYGATLPFDSDWLGTVRDVARAAAQGDLSASVPGSYICVALINDDGTIESLEDNGGVVTEPDTPCFSDGLPADQARVQVVTGRGAEIQAVFFSVDIDLEAPAVTRYERG